MKNLHDKLLSRGAASLTDAELLALLVESPDDRRDPRQTAENLLAAYGSLTAVAHAEIGRLRMSEGLGLRRAERIRLATELGRRATAATAAAVATVTTDADVVRAGDGRRPPSHCQTRPRTACHADNTRTQPPFGHGRAKRCRPHADDPHTRRRGAVRHTSYGSHHNSPRGGVLIPPRLDALTSQKSQRGLLRELSPLTAYHYRPTTVSAGRHGNPKS